MSSSKACAVRWSVAIAKFLPEALVADLVGHAVEAVLIGGIAAAVHGVGLATLDLDILVAPDATNLERLAGCLIELRAEMATFHQPPILPTIERLLASTGPMLMRTKYGRLDVLREAGGEDFASLSVDARQASFGGHAVRVASLPALLRMKRAANRPKDQAAIIALEAELARRLG